METVLEWLRANNDVVGFGVATLIFFITIILVSRKMIGFAMTVLFLLFSLFTGLIIANLDFIKELMRSTPSNSNSEISLIPDNLEESTFYTE